MSQGKLVVGSINGHIVGMTLPMIWGILAMIGFNVADTYFVGQLGKAELEAMTFTFPVVMIYFSLSIGLSIGASSVIARAVGEDDDELVRRLCTDSLTLSFVIVAVFVALGLATIEPVFRLLGASPSAIVLIKKYMVIWYYGMPFLVVPMVGNAAIRALGDASTPSKIMIASAVMNIILDPLLIFGYLGFPRWGLEGAAIATVIARVFTFIASLYFLIYREKMITLARVSLKEMMRSWKAILAIASPSAATNMITPLSAAIVTAMLSKYGAEAVAGFGVATRIESLAVIPMYAMSSIIGPFVGQNLGAKEYGRMKQGVHLTYMYSMGWGALVTVVLFALGTPIASLFSANESTIELAAFYLMIVPITFGLQGIIFMVNATFNAVGHPLRSTFLSMCRMFFFYIPPAYLLSLQYDAFGIVSAAAISNAATGTLAWYMLRRHQNSFITSSNKSC